MIEEIRARLGQCRIVRDLAQAQFEPTPITSLDIETAGRDKKVGDAPYFDGHGIAGITLGNLKGDSMYLVTNDNRDYGGIPVAKAIEFVNKVLGSAPVKVVTCHYSKFDLGFLCARGLHLNGVRVVDTWALSNIKSEGNYSANKLKDIVRKKLNITTTSEEEKDKWLKEHGTEDYGDVPVEIMGRYAADDVRYGLLSLLTTPNIDEDDWACHDLVIRNDAHLRAAERRGILLNVPLLRQRLQIARETVTAKRAKVVELLGAACAAVNPDDDQQILKHLHAKNLHNAPREQYGETKYVYDDEFLRSVAPDHDLARDFMDFHRMKDFISVFSPDEGELGTRIERQADSVAIHTQHLQSIFSKGGLILSTIPDFRERVKLRNETRALFQCRKGHVFIPVRAFDFFATLLAWYCKDAALLATVPQGEFVGTLSVRSKVPAALVSMLLRKIIEGHGFELLERRARLVGVKGMDKKALYRSSDALLAALGQYAAMDQNLKNALQGNGFVRDRGGRRLRIEPAKHWRAVAILLQSSYGSILGQCFDLFCRVANETRAHLVLAHENEWLFEVADVSLFTGTLREVLAQAVIEPKPCFVIGRPQAEWTNEHLDSHQLGLNSL